MHFFSRLIVGVAKTYVKITFRKEENVRIILDNQTMMCPRIYIHGVTLRLLLYADVGADIRRLNKLHNFTHSLRDYRIGTRSVAILGVRNILPIFLQTDLRVNDTGHFRFQISRGDSVCILCVPDRVLGGNLPRMRQNLCN